MLLEQDINDTVQQGMAGTNQRRLWLAGYSDTFFFKDDAFIALQNGDSARAQHVHLVTDLQRNASDLVTMRLPLIPLASQAFQRLQEKRGDKMRL